MGDVVERGRSVLVQQGNGKRFKLVTRSGIYIDCMYVDRSGDKHSPNGRTLIITCEGNAGFYEFGSNPALRANYAVLMWNHPGFMGSGGRPWPCEEEAAVDVVFQFAMVGLQWEPRDIVLYGWSIGGFAATWAAMTYRDIGGLILDATFDDVMPVALSHWPWNCTRMVTRVVRKYINLDIGKQLAYYNGPVVVIRRTKDEIMTVVETTKNPGEKRLYNRTNYVLKGLLVNRYPNVFDDDIDWLVDLWLRKDEKGRVAMLRAFAVDNDEWSDELDQQRTLAADFPMMIGDEYELEQRFQLALYLLSRYLVEFRSKHGSPLPVDKFIVPRHPWE